MFSFTKQEQTVLSLFITIVLSGALLQYAFKRYPSLKDIVNLTDSDRIYGKVNINTAPFDELVAIPYIGEYTAANIIQYRETQGPFTDIQQVKNVKGIREKNYARFHMYLKI